MGVSKTVQWARVFTLVLWTSFAAATAVVADDGNGSSQSQAPKIVDGIFDGPDQGFQISVQTPAGIPQKSSQSVKITGTVNLIGSPSDFSSDNCNKGDDGEGGHGDDGNQSKSKVSCPSLIDQLTAQGYVIRAYFPDLTTPVASSALTLSSSDNQSIQFSFSTPALKATDLNLFTLQVVKPSDDVANLQKVQSKLDLRVVFLTSLIQKLSAQPGVSSEDLNELKALLAKVQSTSRAIGQWISLRPDVLAEARFPLQVDNKVAVASLNSSVMGKFRLEVSFDLGSAIDGESTIAHGKVTSLQVPGWDDFFGDDSEDGDDQGDSAHRWVTRFYWNSSLVKELSPQVILDGQSVSFDYPTGTLEPASPDVFSVKLYPWHRHGGGDDDHPNTNAGRVGQLFGSVALSVPVADDSTSPTILSGASPSSQVSCAHDMQPVSITIQDSFGLVDPTSIHASLLGKLNSGASVGGEVTSQLSISSPDQGQTYSVSDSGALNPSQEGVYTFSTASADLAGNATLPKPYAATFRIDRTAPVILLGTTDSIYTNKPYTNKPAISFSATTVDFFDRCSILTTATDNGIEITHTSTSSLNASATLTDGLHVIEIKSSNLSDGLNSLPSDFQVIVDTVPPILSSLQPTSGMILNTLTFSVSGKSNEALLSAKVNGQALTLSQDQLSFSGKLSVPAEGAYTLHFEAIDLATNVTTQDVPVQVILKVLNGSLLSVAPSMDGVHLTIRGAAGATRPGLTVNASSSLFNGGSAVGAADGSFSLSLYPFQSATVTATDPSLGRTDTATVTYGSAGGTLLSGSVRDTNDQPLAGATVSIANTGISTVTDGSGVFTFSQPVIGDQLLVVDGTTIPQVLGSNVQRKFSVTHVAVSIGLSQVSVLQRPIYLQPTIVDPAQQIPSSFAGLREDPNALGVSLDIPANSITFPNNAATGQISMTKISSAVATIAPVSFATPTDVVALEPSGLKFSQPVPLTLPNDNGLPIGVDMVIMSMNSEKGVWEIDGVATVSPDGQSVVTKPNQGITHFSLVYAAPIGPTVLPIGEQDVPGADTFNGALSTSISLPSYKSLGKDISPTLLYKSSWAKPTTVISNLFDIPKNEVSLDHDTGTIQVKLVHACALFLCQDVGVYADVSTTGSAWYEPDYITSQFWMAGITGRVAKFTGMPNRAKVSYATDLIDPATNDYLPSGLYPYFSHWEVHLKHIVVGTRSVTTWSDVAAPQVTTTSLDSVQPINQVFPQDLGGPLFVENEVKSSAGRGWRAGGVEKIVNPTENRVMIEEGDGRVSSFAINNTISTVYDANSLPGDLGQGTDLSSWPTAYLTSSNGSVLKADLSNPGAPAALVSAPYPIEADIPGFAYTNVSLSIFQFSRCYQSNFHYSAGARSSQLLALPNGQFFGTDPARSQLFQGQVGSAQTRRLAGYLATPASVSPELSSAFFFCQFQGSTCYDSFGQPSDYGIPEARSAASSYCSGLPLANCTQTLDSTISPQGYNQCGPYLFSSGVYPAAGFSADTSLNTPFHSPKGITAGPRAGTIVVADYGNNLVRLVDLNSNSVQTLAGNTMYYGWDVGENVPATQVSVSHPMGVVYDAVGNLYISTEAGMIRKVDTTGRITTFAGAQNGLTQDSVLATKTLFHNPYGMVVDNNKGYLYVADTGRQRVVRIEFQTGLAVNVAGSGNTGDSPDGVAAINASLSSPTQVGLDDRGNLLIVDSLNQKIKRVTFQNQSTGVLAFSSAGTLVQGARKNSDGTWVPWLVRNADGTWTRNYRNGVRDFFDATGRQTATVDRVGRQTTFFYNSNGDIASIQDPANRTTVYSYSGSQLSSITDPANRVTYINIDSSTNFLTSVTFPDSSQKAYGYSSDGLMQSETDQRNKTTQYTYNQWNRLHSTLSPMGKTLGVSDSASQTVGNNNVNGTVGTLQPVGNEPGGAQDSMTDGNGNPTQVAKDSRGFVGGVTDASGRQVAIQRNIAGQPTLVTRPDGSSISYSYDNDTEDLLYQTDTSFNITTGQTFDAFGNITSKTTGRHLTSSTVYDPITGLIVSKKDSLGHQTLYHYSGPLTLLTQVTDFRGKSTYLLYDAYGNLTSRTDPLNHTTIYHRDSVGRVDSVTDANNHATLMEYDFMNRLKKVTTPMGKVTQYGYLPTGQLSSITDAASNVATFDFDDDGKMIRKTDALGFYSLYLYDDNGNLKQETDPNGNVKKYTFDNLNRLIQKSLPDNLVSISYDQRGNITQAKNLQSEVDFTFDTIGRLSTAQSQGLGSSSDLPNVLLTYTYDEDSNRKSIQDSLGGLSTYSYDGGDRLAQIINTKGEVFTFDLSQEGSGQFTLSRAMAANQSPFASTTGQVDDAGRMTSLVHQAGGTEISYFIYQMDNIGNRTQIAIDQGTRSISYDNDNQLKTASNPEALAGNSYQAESFSYDELYNRATDQDGSYLYDSKKQRLSEDYRNFYYYDNSGNLTMKQAKAGFPMSEVTNYTYSSENQLLSFKVYEQGSNLPSKEVYYVYDATGRRIRKQVIDHAAPSDLTKSFTRSFVYDGQDILLDLDGFNTLLARYTHSTVGADSVLAVDVTSAGVSAGLARNGAGDIGAGSYFYLKDGLGSVTDIIDSHGQKWQHYVYSAFGEILGIKDALAGDISQNPVLRTSYTFAGRELDSESGFFYNRARYYDPHTGRFLQKDPQPGKLGLPITVTNAYVYAGNNPFNLSDPSGQSFIGDLLLGIVIAIASAFTGGLAAGAFISALSATGAGAIAAGTIAGAVVGGITGGLIEGTAYAIDGKSFAEGFWKGAATGAIAGGFAGALKGLQLANSAGTSTSTDTPSSTGQYQTMDNYTFKNAMSGQNSVADAAASDAVNDPFQQIKDLADKIDKIASKVPLSTLEVGVCGLVILVGTVSSAESLGTGGVAAVALLGAAGCTAGVHYLNK